MRILHILQAQGFGGLETYTSHLFPALAEAGHESRVLRVDAAGALAEASDVRQLDEDPPDVAIVHNRIDDVSAARLSRVCPLVFFEHAYGAICASGSRYLRLPGTECRLLGTPDLRCLANAFAAGCNTRRPGRLRAEYLASRRQSRQLRAAAGVVVDSQYVAHQLAANGVPSETMSILPSPIADDLFGVQRQAEPGRVLFAGRVTPEKGLDRLVALLPRIAGATLAVAGEGHALPRAKAVAQELGVSGRVAWLGRLGRDQLLDEYARAAVVVVPSLWPEPWGMVGPEAMAASAPVVAFASGGIPEWLQDGATGHLVPAGDDARMAAAIGEVLSDGQRATQMGEAGRERARALYRYPGHVAGLIGALDAGVRRWRDMK